MNPQTNLQNASGQSEGCQNQNWIKAPPNLALAVCGLGGLKCRLISPYSGIFNKKLFEEGKLGKYLQNYRVLFEFKSEKENN